MRLTAHNGTIGRWSGARTALKTVLNQAAYARVREVLARFRPAIMHCTNTFPLLSPAVYYAARAAGVPVVQSLHNYRLICPGAVLFRNGRVCEECMGRRLAWPCVLHGCYRGSCAATAVVAGMLAVHRLAGTWSRVVDRYIALTEFSRQKFIEGGLPGEKITVKPNFVDPDPGQAAGQGGYAVFVGRLADGKGVDCLLAAWKAAPGLPPLKIVGDGPLAPHVQQAAADDPRIQWLGWRPLAEVMATIGRAEALVMPSMSY
jgi:glycosyltransferase involved in cell wall biosynthesis